MSTEVTSLVYGVKQISISDATTLSGGAFATTTNEIVISETKGGITLQRAVTLTNLTNDRGEVDGVANESDLTTFTLNLRNMTKETFALYSGGYVSGSMVVPVTGKVTYKALKIITRDDNEALTSFEFLIPKASIAPNGSQSFAAGDAAIPSLTVTILTPRSGDTDSDGNIMPYVAVDLSA